MASSTIFNEYVVDYEVNRRVHRHYNGERGVAGAPNIEAANLFFGACTFPALHSIPWPEMRRLMHVFRPDRCDVALDRNNDVFVEHSADGSKLLLIGTITHHIRLYTPRVTGR